MKTIYRKVNNTTESRTVSSKDAAKLVAKGWTFSKPDAPKATKTKTKSVKE